MASFVVMEGWALHGDVNAGLVCLHGFLGDHRDWDELSVNLDSKGILSVDLPGHGQSELPSSLALNFQNTVDSLAQVLSSTCSDPIVLLGYSLGGRVALATALRHPELVQGLILESASPGILDEMERGARRQWDLDLAKRMTQTAAEHFLTEWYGMELFSSLKLQPDLQRRLIDKRSEQDLDSASRTLTFLGAGSQPSYWEALGRIQVPTLLITGELDRKYRSIAVDMENRSKLIQWREVPGAGHIVHLEKALDYAELVQHFLEDQIGGRAV